MQAMHKDAANAPQRTTLDRAERWQTTPAHGDGPYSHFVVTTDGESSITGNCVIVAITAFRDGGTPAPPPAAHLAAVERAPQLLDALCAALDARPPGRTVPWAVLEQAVLDGHGTSRPGATLTNRAPEAVRQRDGTVRSIAAGSTWHVLEAAYWTEIGVQVHVAMDADAHLVLGLDELRARFRPEEA